jgi:hypothetical protein
LDAAIRIAERYTWNHPRDPNGFLVLGDAYAAKMPDGRFRALDNYRQARQLAPASVEPAYRMAQMGLRLGGDDGERIAKDNLERVLGRDPLYKDAWGEWLFVYRNSGGRSEMIHRLKPFSGVPIVQTRIAQLLIENEQYTEANAILDAGLSGDTNNVSLLALRAQSALEAADTINGLLYYSKALANARSDSNDVLWRQVIGIATPGEIINWRTGLRSSQKGQWLRSFWHRRNPNLFSGTNHRIAEHFARERYARKHFPLLHPFVLYQRSGIARALNLEPSVGERQFRLKCEANEGPLTFLPGGGISAIGASVTELSRVFGDPSNLLFIPLNLDLRSVDTVAARVGYNLATGLDDRGIMYLRFGAPQRVMVGGENSTDPTCFTTQVERWRYADLGEVRFAKPSAFSTGLDMRNLSEMVFRPMNEHQFAVMGEGLTQNASSEPAPLSFGVWESQFRNASDPVERT